MDAMYAIGSEVGCSDGVCGKLTRVIVDPVKRALTYLVVEPAEGPSGARLVPAEYVNPDAPATAIILTCDRAAFERLEYAQTEEFLPAQDDALGFGVEGTLWMPYFPVGAALPGSALGAPGEIVGPGPAVATGAGSGTISRDRVPAGEVQIRRGQRVHATDGDIGKVRGLAVDPTDGLVTHVLLDEGHLWGKKTVAIPVGAVESVSDGIRLSLAKDEVRELPELALTAVSGGH